MGQLDTTYGAMLIGVYFTTFFQGLLTFQTYRYFDKYPKDPMINKITVFTVWSIDTIHLVLVAKSAYYYLVTQWGNPEALATSIWELDVQLTFIALSVFVCQLFFLKRIWILGNKKNIILVLFVFCLCLSVLVIEIYVTVKITLIRSVTEFLRQKIEVIVIFTTSAVADQLIALSLCYYLRRDKTIFQRTHSLVKRVLQYTIVTGLLTSTFAIATIILYFANEKAFYFIGIHFSTGRMYTNALLATLNARNPRVNFQIGQTSSGSRGGRLLSGSNTSTETQYIAPFMAKGEVNAGSVNPLAVNYVVEETTEHDIELSDSVKMTNIV